FLSPFLSPCVARRVRLRLLGRSPHHLAAFCLLVSLSPCLLFYLGEAFAVFSRFFFYRPIFAWVLCIVIVLAGGVALFPLPVAQSPEIAPPTVEVSASYPGANAQVVADTVAAPIEQSVNGVEGMMYMSSQCTNDGNYTLTITFKPGTDLNIAQVLVQNRESLAEPILPDLVKRRGISVKKKSPNVLMIVNLFSEDQSRKDL